MAFKLPRGNKLTLGHNGQIKPITTRFAGDGGDLPLKEVDEAEVPWDSEFVDSGDKYILRAKRSRSGEVGDEFLGANYDQLPQSDDEFVNPSMPDQTWPEWVDAPCGSPGKPWGSVINGVEVCPEDKKTSPGKDESETRDVQGSTENPSFNVLTPHLRRRNARMQQGAGRQDEKTINAANRRVRTAIRRGKEPMQGDMDILSGIGLGGWEGFDPNQMTGGNVSMFSGHRTKAYSGKGGSTQLTAGQMRTQAQAIQAANPGMEPWEAMEVLEAQLATGGGSGSANYTGMHIDDKTMKLMNKKGYDLTTYGIDPKAKVLNTKTKNPKRIDQGGEGTAVGNFLRNLGKKAEKKAKKIIT